MTVSFKHKKLITMKKFKKKKLIIWVSIALFFIFEYLTFGGIHISFSETWWPVGNSVHAEGKFKPYIRFGSTSKRRTIIPIVLYIHTSKPTNTIEIKRSVNVYSYEYERFKYVRFTKFEVHYESGHVQILLEEDSPIRERKYNVIEGSITGDSLFLFELERIEKCTVVIEGYSKFIEGDKEEFFKFTKDWYIKKSRDIRTGGDRIASI